jgi:hypothetical protein
MSMVIHAMRSCYARRLVTILTHESLFHVSVFLGAIYMSTVHMLIMHIVTMHKSYNASIFQDPDVVPK